MHFVIASLSKSFSQISTCYNGVSFTKVLWMIPGLAKTKYLVSMIYKLNTMIKNRRTHWDKLLKFDCWQYFLLMMVIMENGGFANTLVGTFKRRRSSLTQQLLTYQDMLTNIFTKRYNMIFNLLTIILNVLFLTYFWIKIILLKIC